MSVMCFKISTVCCTLLTVAFVIVASWAQHQANTYPGQSGYPGRVVDLYNCTSPCNDLGCNTTVLATIEWTVNQTMPFAERNIVIRNTPPWDVCWHSLLGKRIVVFCDDATPWKIAFWRFSFESACLQPYCAMSYGFGISAAFLALCVLLLCAATCGKMYEKY